MALVIFVPSVVKIDHLVEMLNKGNKNTHMISN